MPLWPYDKHFCSFLSQTKEPDQKKKNTKSPYHVNVTRMMAQSSAHGVPSPPAKDFS